jgi:DNA-binding CsgD family transcriptional regulator
MKTRPLPAADRGARATEAENGRARPPRMLCPTLVGRERELAALEEVFGEVRTGGGRTVLLAGDAGIGKSRVLATFLARARASGAEVLSSQCVEIEARRPFGPFSEALRRLPEAARLAPGGSDRAAVDPDQRYRTMRLYANALIDLARKGPVVIAIDDLHWADEESLQLFRYLATALRPRAVLLIGTYRSDELQRLHPLRPHLAALAQARLADTITIGRLTPEATAEMVRATLGVTESKPRALPAAIDEHCEGNPFFVEELLKVLVESGRLVYRDRAWHHDGSLAELTVPPTVRDAVQDRIARLSEGTRRMVHVASVIGPTFDFALLGQLAGLPDEALTGALREAIDAQLFEEDSSQSDLFRFRHALTRESVLAELLGRERRALHGQIAVALEKRAGTSSHQIAEDLAYHFDEAGVGEKAFRYHELAGRQAETLFAFGQARSHLERALELAPNEADLAGLQLRFAKAAAQVGEGRAALRAAQEAVQAYRDRGDARGAGVALCALSDIQWWFRRPDDAISSVEEAVRVLEPMGPTAELADAYVLMTDRHVLVSEDLTTMWAERAIRLARQLGLRETEASGLLQLGSALVRAGRSEGRSHLEDGLRMALELDSPVLALNARYTLTAATLRFGGPPAERRLLHQEAVEHAKRHRYTNDLLLSRQVEEAIADGGFDEALRVATQMTQDSVHAADTELRLTLVSAARGGPEALPDLDALRQRLIAGGRIWRNVAATTSQVLLLCERPADALAHAEIAVELLLGGSYRAGADIAVICGMEAARRLDDDAALDRWIALAMRAESDVESRVRKARRAYGAAERARRDGDLDRAIDSFGVSVAALAGEQWPFVETLARLRRAEVLLERARVEDNAAARIELATVATFWRKADAGWYLRRLGKWARAHGLAMPPQPPARGRPAKGTLTPREREVAALIAEGLTNRQIAQRLVISERTVESHVERIMGRLAVHSRSGIAAWSAAARV